MPRKLVPERYTVGTFGANPPATVVVDAWRRMVADDTRRQRLEAPAVLLSEYFRERGRSRLGKLLTTAAPFTAAYDPLVFVGCDAAVSSAAAFFAATAHPFYNQLADGGRGGRPRLALVAPTLDNDQLQAVFDLLKTADESHTPGHRWGFVVQRPSPDASAEVRNETTNLEALFVEALGKSANERIMTLDEVSPGYVATVPDDSHLAALMIVATAAIGGDVVSLFKGAAWFQETAKHAIPTECEPVRLADFFVDPNTEIVVWHHALEPIAKRFAGGVRVVAGFDPPARRELLRDASRRRVHLFTDVVRRDRVSTSLPSIADVYQEVRNAENAAGTNACEIRLTRLNDQSLGELCAWIETAKLIADAAHSEI